MQNIYLQFFFWSWHINFLQLCNDVYIKMDSYNLLVYLQGSTFGMEKNAFMHGTKFTISPFAALGALLAA